MALVMSLTLPATTAIQNDVVVDIPEITYPQSYARVMYVRAFSKESYICVCWYADEAARFANADPVKVNEYTAETKALSGDFYPAVYAHLKTLPEFAGASDHPLVDPAEVVEPTPVEPEPIPEPTQPEAQA